MLTGRKNIFIDVGGGLGETLLEVTGALWKFDLIYSFEPQETMLSQLRTRFSSEIKSGRVVVIPAGLADFTGEKILYGEGHGASIYAEKQDIDSSKKQIIKLIDVAEFFRENISNDDMVIMKLNCEGSEGIILESLAESAQIEKLTNIMIDFDLRKIRGMKQEPKNVIRLLKKIDFKHYFLVKEVMLGKTHEQRIRNWLAQIPELEEFCNDPLIARNSIKKAKFHRRIRMFFRHF